MNEAQKFLDSLISCDSNTVYEALADADVQESQDWENGVSTWTFSDGSEIVMSGPDVAVAE